MDVIVIGEDAFRREERNQYFPARLLLCIVEDIVDTQHELREDGLSSFRSVFFYGKVSLSLEFKVEHPCDAAVCNPEEIAEGGTFGCGFAYAVRKDNGENVQIGEVRLNDEGFVVVGGQGLHPFLVNLSQLKLHPGGRLCHPFLEKPYHLRRVSLEDVLYGIDVLKIGFFRDFADARGVAFPDMEVQALLKFALSNVFAVEFKGAGPEPEQGVEHVYKAVRIHR